MDIFDVEVDFNKYCNQCVHKDKEERKDPCNECLEYGYNVRSEKPIHFAKKTGAVMK